MNINVIGIGIMGSQISALLKLCGYKVHIYTKSKFNIGRLQKDVNLLRKVLKLRDVSADFRFCSDLNDLVDGLTIETVYEDLYLKREIYYQVRKKHGGLYATNSSSINPSDIGDDVLGIHFFNPINIGLVELAANGINLNQPEISEFIFSLSNIGFEVVNVKNNSGYVGNFLLFSEIAACLRLIDYFGYTPTKIKAVSKHLYKNRDIFTIIDRIGTDTTLKILNNLSNKDNYFYIPKCLEVAVECGILGKKNRTSFLDLFKQSPYLNFS